MSLQVEKLEHNMAKLTIEVSVFFPLSYIFYMFFYIFLTTFSNFIPHIQ